MKIVKSTLIFCILLASSAVAYASQCNMATFDEAYNEAEIIVVGTAIDITYLEKRFPDPNIALCGNKVVTFKTIKTLKGSPRSQIEVLSADACFYLGSYFEKGKDYLVYAYSPSAKRKWKGKNGHYPYETGSCVRTAPVNATEALNDVKLLEKLNSFYLK